MTPSLVLQLAASLRWPAVAVVLIVVVMIATCGVEYVNDELPGGGRHRHFRIRRIKDDR